MLKHGAADDAAATADFGTSAVLRCSSVKKVLVAEEMNARFRYTMEDAYVVEDALGGDPETGYFGVYDGHGGREVAEYLRVHLHKNVEKWLSEAGSSRTAEESVAAAFVATDVECSKAGDYSSGSTACVCIVRTQGPRRYVVTANCGDARAVLCADGRAVRLSKDHKACDAEEQARVEALGGFVIRKRVMGVLAVARAFGDFLLKKYVPAQPYTSTTKLDARSQFIILACDGIWDVLEDQEAVDLVRENMGGAGGGRGAGAGGRAPANRVAQVLIDAALSRGSTDNVTVLVIFL